MKRRRLKPLQKFRPVTFHRGNNEKPLFTEEDVEPAEALIDSSRPEDMANAFPKLQRDAYLCTDRHWFNWNGKFYRQIFQSTGKCTPEINPKLSR